jgi:hypothetical protein
MLNRLFYRGTKAECEQFMASLDYQLILKPYIKAKFPFADATVVELIPTSGPLILGG